MRLTGFRRTGVFRLLSHIAHAFLPWQLVERLREKVQGTRYEPPVGRVQFGSFRRLAPISRTWGYDRGGSIARYCIERFFAQHCEDIPGRVLEITNSRYTQQFGDDRVTQSDVLDLTSENPNATIVADLTHGEGVPSGVFDCIILAQTLHVIEDSQAAIHTLHRILKPAGVVLATLPGISPIRPSDLGRVLVRQLSLRSKHVREGLLCSKRSGADPWKCLGGDRVFRRIGSDRTASV